MPNREPLAIESDSIASDIMDMVHPTDDQLRDFLRGRLGTAEIEQVADHVESCRQCGDRLATIEGEDRDDSLLGALPLMGGAGSIDHESETITSPPMPGPSDGGDELVGRTLGDFELIDVLGRGGMGVVYKARQISLDRLVALKLMRAGESAGEAALRRFEMEARAVANLQHENIVQVYAYGSFENRRYIAMEFIEGRTLAEELREGPLELRRAMELVATLAEAMEYAHAQGILHRDLKPANVMIGCDGRPRILDFGLVKRLDDDSLETRHGQIVGTPSYMSWEQAWGQGLQLDARTDVWSLGAILFHTLTGRPPFQAANVTQTLLQLRDVEPVEPRRLSQQVERDLQGVCLRTLRKDREERYPSAGALAADLRACLEGRPVSGVPWWFVLSMLFKRHWHVQADVATQHAALGMGVVNTLFHLVLFGITWFGGGWTACQVVVVTYWVASAIAISWFYVRDYWRLEQVERACGVAWLATLASQALLLWLIGSLRGFSVEMLLETWYPAASVAVGLNLLVLATMDGRIFLLVLIWTLIGGLAAFVPPIGPLLGALVCGTTLPWFWFDLQRISRAARQDAAVASSALA